jgi:hypothetical protein
MYVNGKMRPVEIVPGMEGGIYCKNFCKCHNIFPTAQYKKKKRKQNLKKICLS